MNRSKLLAVAGPAASVILLLVLAWLTGIDWGSIIDAVNGVSPEVLGLVAILTLTNQLCGALRWRIINRTFAPGLANIPTMRLVEITTWASLVGQFLPTQISNPIVRWAAFRGHRVIGPSLYEQIYDLLVLLGAAFGTMLFLLGVMTYWQSALIACIIVLTSAGSLRGFCQSAGNRMRSSKLREAAVELGSVPNKLVFNLVLISSIRFGLLASRAAFLLTAVIGALGLYQSLIIFPFAGIAMAIPGLPGGLGATELAWTGGLTSLGISAAASASAAITLRLVTVMILTVLAPTVTVIIWLTGLARNLRR